MEISTEVICADTDPNAAKLIKDAEQSGKYLCKPFVSSGNYIAPYLSE